MLLDPEARQDIIKSRSKALKAVNPDYNAGKMALEIGYTCGAMEKIASMRSAGDGSVRLMLTKLNPAFRIILTDTAAYVSAYQEDCHGHQAPVLKIRKTFGENGPTGMSLYAAFAAHFDNLKADSVLKIDKTF